MSVYKRERERERERERFRGIHTNSLTSTYVFSQGDVLPHGVQ
jgi:hypothetical protein